MRMIRRLAQRLVLWALDSAFEDKLTKAREALTSDYAAMERALQTQFRSVERRVGAIDARTQLFTAVDVPVYRSSGLLFSVTYRNGQPIVQGFAIDPGTPPHIIKRAINQLGGVDILDAPRPMIPELRDFFNSNSKRGW